MKKILSVILALFLCFSFIGCEKKVDPIVGKWVESYTIYDNEDTSSKESDSSRNSEIIIRDNMTYTLSVYGNIFSGNVVVHESDKDNILYGLKYEDGKDTGMVLAFDLKDENECILGIYGADYYIVYSRK